jgi:ABC-type Fe3+ transport system substrate-binding protein
VRAAAQGRLLTYRPAGFSQLWEGFKDPHGTWSAMAVIAFSYLYDSAKTGTHSPKSPKDLADPRWKGQIASSYPNDDDAALYLYKLYTDAYGWDWIGKLAKQDIQFARGSNSPAVAVDGGRKTIGIATSGSLLATGADKWTVDQGQPFMAWGQRAAILKDAPHPAAAKLYRNWQLSKPVQEASFNGWSVRTDVQPPGGLKPIWTYKNAHLEGFPQFMSDRAEVERWRQTFALYFGEVQGKPSPGWLGLHPGR